MNASCFFLTLGDHGGYSRNSIQQHPSTVSSVYSTLPHPHVQMAPAYCNNTQPRSAGSSRQHVRCLSTELDLDSGCTTAAGNGGSHYTQLTTPIVIETSNNAAEVGPICASSPKRSMSAFTTFGPGSRSNVTTPMSPPSSGPASGHLV